MDTNSRLIEREAESRVSKKDLCNIDTDTEMAIDFDIKLNSSPQVRYQNIEGEWRNLFTIKDLIDIEISDNSIVDYDLILSDKVTNGLKKLQKKILRSYDEELDMYELSYKLNEDGSSELCIPLKTGFTDDLTIQRIYNENEEFVAQNVEENAKFPIHKLKTKKLYVKHFPNTNRDEISVYCKREMTASEIMNDDDGPKTEPLEIITGCYLLPLGLYGAVFSVYTLTGSTILASALFLFFCLFYLAPLILPLGGVILTFGYIYSYIKSKTDKYNKKTLAFKSKG